MEEDYYENRSIIATFSHKHGFIFYMLPMKTFPKSKLALVF